MAWQACAAVTASLNPYTIERLRERQSWDSINIMALAAATASLEDPGQVTKGRRLNAETRAFTTGELEKMGFQTIPSQANFIMIDVKRPVVPLIATLKTRKVEVGRLFRPMPNHLRVTIGKKSEMEAFLAAFREVTAARFNLDRARPWPIVRAICGTAGREIVGRRAGGMRRSRFPAARYADVDRESRGVTRSLRFPWSGSA